MPREMIKKGKVLLSCNREGIYRNINVKTNQSTKGSRTINSKKYGYPFLLKGKELSKEEGWVLLAACDFHNHFAAENLEGHSFIGRLSEEEEKLTVDMSKTLVRLRDILNTLKQRSNLNVSILRIIYNARKKFKIVEYAVRSRMQLLMKNLSKHTNIKVIEVIPILITFKTHDVVDCKGSFIFEGELFNIIS